MDGVLAEAEIDGQGGVEFHEASELTQEHWEELERTVQRRVLRAFRKRGLLAEDAARVEVERLVRNCARGPLALERLHAPQGSQSLTSPDARLVYRLSAPDPNGRTEGKDAALHAPESARPPLRGDSTGRADAARLAKHLGRSGGPVPFRSQGHEGGWTPYPARVELYVIAADVCGRRPFVGRCGWTWYTGAAPWTYRLAVEGTLGLRLVDGALEISPCLPPDWPSFEARARRGGLVVRVVVHHGGSAGVARIQLDGDPAGAGPRRTRGERTLELWLPRRGARAGS